MIRLTYCHQSYRVGEYFRLHLGPGDNPSAPIAPFIPLRSFWIGPALSDLSLSQHVLPAASELVRLGRGFHPRQKVRLAPSKNRKRAYYDLTVSPTKTISLAALLMPGHSTAGSIAHAHIQAMRAVGEAVGEMIQPRSGTGPGKWLGAVFTHTHTREGDPHLHSHLVMPNIAKNKENQWRAMEVVIAGENRLRLELIYANHLTRSLRRLGLGDELVMRDNGQPELRSLLPFVKKYSRATRAVIKAARMADAAQPARAVQSGIHAGELHPRSLLPVPHNDLALKRRRRLANQIRRPKAKASDDPIRLNDEARRWCQALSHPEHRSLTRLLDDVDYTNPRRPPRVVEKLPPAASLIVRAAYDRIHCDLKITDPLLLRAAVAESAGRHAFQELDAACQESLTARKAALKRIRARIAADDEAIAIARAAKIRRGTGIVAAGAAATSSQAAAVSPTPTSTSPLAITSSPPAQPSRGARR